VETKVNISRRLTADKRLRYASPKLPSATSSIRKLLCEITLNKIKGANKKWLIILIMIMNL
jgi:hypothetical protein